VEKINPFPRILGSRIHPWLEGHFIKGFMIDFSIYTNYIELKQLKKQVSSNFQVSKVQIL
jgi:hypothetical protein